MQRTITEELLPYSCSINCVQLGLNLEGSMHPKVMASKSVIPRHFKRWKLNAQARELLKTNCNRNKQLRPRKNPNRITGRRPNRDIFYARHSSKFKSDLEKMSNTQHQSQLISPPFSSRNSKTAACERKGMGYGRACGELVKEARVRGFIAGDENSTPKLEHNSNANCNRNKQLRQRNPQHSLRTAASQSSHTLQFFVQISICSRICAPPNAQSTQCRRPLHNPSRD